MSRCRGSGFRGSWWLLGACSMSGRAPVRAGRAWPCRCRGRRSMMPAGACSSVAGRGRACRPGLAWVQGIAPSPRPAPLLGVRAGLGRSMMAAAFPRDRVGARLELEGGVLAWILARFVPSPPLPGAFRPASAGGPGIPHRNEHPF